MSRSAIGFLIGTGSILAADAAMLAAHPSNHLNSPMAWVIAWWVVNFPAIPFVWALIQVTPTARAEPWLTDWDYLMIAATMLCASLAWGSVGAIIGRLTTRQTGESESIAP